ncbi:MAG: hypothetical protein ACLVJH_02835 [Faecalibacterium prausnitzii]
MWEAADRRYSRQCCKVPTYNADRSVLPDGLVGRGVLSDAIYFDFSGYSDIAIGLSLCFGFHFKENLTIRNISASIQEFWRRWHIPSPGIPYIPLGGNRKGKAKTYWNKPTCFSARGCAWCKLDLYRLGPMAWLLSWQRTPLKAVRLEKHGKGGRKLLRVRC